MINKQRMPPVGSQNTANKAVKKANESTRIYSECKRNGMVEMASEAKRLMVMRVTRRGPTPAKRY
jgi:hypothetical protein